MYLLKSEDNSLDLLHACMLSRLFPVAPELAVRFFISSATWEDPDRLYNVK